MNKEDYRFGFIMGCIFGISVGFFASTYLDIDYITKAKELTYSQRRDIAITFMCTEHNTWKGAKAFCGSIPMDSDGVKK